MDSITEKTIDIEKVLNDKMGPKAKWVPGFVVRYLKHIVHEDQINDFMQKALKSAEDKYNATQGQVQLEPVNFNGQTVPLLPADAQKYKQMMDNAQSELTKIQQNAANQLQMSNKQLSDSVDNFLRDFSRQNNYDVILKKGATFYINPSLDVTDKVIEGLNKRYTKVAKK